VSIGVVVTKNDIFKQKYLNVNKHFAALTASRLASWLAAPRRGRPVLLVSSLLTAQATYRANQAIAAQRAATACLKIALLRLQQLQHQSSIICSSANTLSLTYAMFSKYRV